MGGIAGSQTLVVALRGLVLNHITSANLRLLLTKELQIAIINGAISGSVILTTVTDVVGFVVFLGLGSLVLMAVWVQ